MDRIRIIDTHTAGEPTRIVIEGGPDFGAGSVGERRERFRHQFDHLRTALVMEPRGSDVWVGAMLVPPSESDCVTGVIFFNNVGYLNMCGHGAMGVTVALGRMGRIGPGRHRFDTPVGVVEVEYDGGNAVALDNVPSYRLATDVTVAIHDYGPVTGDIAWGGNWFFLVNDFERPLFLHHVEELTRITKNIRVALQDHGFAGDGGMEIDHIELCGPAHDGNNHGRNFVLCPGHAYDRSPCGTGTSAKLACLQADGKLMPGQIWRQEGILGTVFEGSFRMMDERIIPTIRGTAFVTAESTLTFDPDDPFCWGIRP